MANFDELTGAAAAVENETLTGGNTAARVGGVMGDTIEMLARVPGVIDGVALTGGAAYGSLQNYLTALQQSGYPAAEIAEGKMIAWRNVRGGSTGGARLRLSRFKGGDTWDETAWEECNVDNYSWVLDWSGETVADVEVTETSLMNPAGGAVVWDTARRTFLYRTGTAGAYAYHNNWACTDGRPSLNDFQDYAWQSLITDWQGCLRPAIFKGTDGSIWLPVSRSEIVCVVLSATDEAYPEVVTFSGETVANPSPVDEMTLADGGTGEVVWATDSGSNRFLLRKKKSTTGVQYYAVWSGLENGQSDMVALQKTNQGGLYGGKLYKGQNGTTWQATGTHTLTRVYAPEAYQETDYTSGGFGGIFAGVDDDITEANPATGARLWWLRSRACLGWGTVSLKSETWDGTRGVARFAFTGKITYTQAEINDNTGYLLGGRLVLTSSGRLAPGGDAPLLLADRWGSRHELWQMSSGHTSCRRLWDVEAGDWLMPDGVLVPSWANVYFRTEAIGVVVDPSRRLFVPLPFETAAGTVYGSGKNSNLGLETARQLTGAASAIEAAQVFDAAEFGLTLTASEVLSYFPAFYDARYGSGRELGYRRMLPTRAEAWALTYGAGSPVSVSVNAWYVANSGTYPIKRIVSVTPEVLSGQTTPANVDLMEGYGSARIPMTGNISGGIPLLAMFPM